MRLIPALTLAAALIVTATPLAAQSAKSEGGSDTINAVIVYGKDECPKPVGDEITICARKPEAERYRIPQGLRETPTTKAESWNSRVMAYERLGKTGTLSCTPTGPGGWTGCSQQLIDRAYAEKHGGEDLQFGKILDQERAKRLSTVDADAAATQARVEQAEKDYDARQRAEAEAVEKAQAATASPSGK